MRSRSWVLTAAALLAACGGVAQPSSQTAPGSTARAGRGPLRGTSATADARRIERRRRTSASARPEALVTAETENRLLVVDVPSGRITRSIQLPSGPEYVAAAPGVAVVVCTNARAVALLEGPSLRLEMVLHGFSAPHIAQISPDRQYAYITDDGRGTLTVIRLRTATMTSTVDVGAGAHHLTFRPDGRRVWVALGESARAIVTLDSSNPAAPRILGRFDPGFSAHDLSFTPDGRAVWVTSADDGEVRALGAGDHRLMFDVPVGPPPQHVVFDGASAYLTSGYGSRILQVETLTGKLLRRAAAPYGSFEADVADGFVATSSLLDGALAIYSRRLALLRVVRLAPVTRDVAIKNA